MHDVYIVCSCTAAEQYESSGRAVYLDWTNSILFNVISDIQDRIKHIESGFIELEFG